MTSKMVSCLKHGNGVNDGLDFDSFYGDSFT